MSALRLSRPGYPTQLIPQGPARAVVQGVGGAALGWYSGTTLTAKQRRANEPKKRTPRQPLDRP